MSLFLMAQYLAGLVAVLTGWVFAHAFAARGGRVDQLIAAALGVIMMAVLAVILLRDIEGLGVDRAIELMGAGQILTRR